jgi:hypothetical protein
VYGGVWRTCMSASSGPCSPEKARSLQEEAECDNIPALRLYDGAGFGEVCPYHYRTARSPGEGGQCVNR